MAEQGNDTEAVEAVKYELDGKGRQQDPEHLLGHEHAALVQVRLTRFQERDQRDLGPDADQQEEEGVDDQLDVDRCVVRRCPA